MDNEYWKSSPFGENSLFSPKLDVAQNKSSQKLGRIVSISAKKGDYTTPTNNSPSYYALQSQSNRYDSNNTQGSKRVEVTIFVKTEGVVECVYISIGTVRKRAIDVRGQYCASFSVEIPDSEIYKNIEVSAQITDFVGKEIYDERSYEVMIGVNGNIVNETNNECILTLDILKQIAPNATINNINRHLQSLNATMALNFINTYLRVVHFLAQLMHESSSLRDTKEIGKNENDYEGFYGRGLIQLTGKPNYIAYQQFCGEDVSSSLNNRQKIENSPHAALSSGWFWSVKNLNYYADKNDFICITYIINGGYNGFKDRLCFLKNAANVLSKYYDEEIKFNYTFDNSAAFSIPLACFAWGLWHDPDTNKEGCTKNKNEAINGYKRMLEIIPSDYTVHNRYSIQKMDIFADIKNSNGEVYLDEAARKRIIELSK